MTLNRNILFGRKSDEKNCLPTSHYQIQLKMQQQLVNQYSLYLMGVVLAVVIFFRFHSDASSATCFKCPLNTHNCLNHFVINMSHKMNNNALFIKKRLTEKKCFAFIFDN